MAEEKKPIHQASIAIVIEELVTLSRYFDQVVTERDQLRERLYAITDALAALRHAAPALFVSQTTDEPPAVHNKGRIAPEEVDRQIQKAREDTENKCYPVPPQPPPEEFKKQDSERCDAVSKSGNRCTRPKGHEPPHQHDSRAYVQSWGEEK